MKPWDATLLDEELKLIGQYGLRNKLEVRRFRKIVKDYQRTARRLLTEERGEGRQFLAKLYRQGIIERGATLSDVLDLTTRDLLERRLQTVVHRRGLAKTLYQARQMITHGHIAVDGRRVTVPSFIVERDAEDKITYWKNSPLNSPDHPIRRDMAG
ncbi:TPA: 30S ribosomal protein S4 [Candidatus Bathyarchaeota archaeon]|nr:30S ribosomal protein S4 [Candidatus Bathyarchaeota archaeon]